MIRKREREGEREKEQVVNDDGNGKYSAGGSVVGGGDVFDARRWSEGRVMKKWSVIVWSFLPEIKLM